MSFVAHYKQEAKYTPECRNDVVVKYVLDRALEHTICDNSTKPKHVGVICNFLLAGAENVVLLGPGKWTHR